MKALLCLVSFGLALSGCISTSSPPKETTVIVPRDSKTVVVCQNGTQPPCN